MLSLARLSAWLGRKDNEEDGVLQYLSPPRPAGEGRAGSSAGSGRTGADPAPWGRQDDHVRLGIGAVLEELQGTSGPLVVRSWAASTLTATRGQETPVTS